MLRKLGLIILGISVTIYITLCLLLRWGQTRLIFVPDNQLSSTPEKYNLDYQEIWIDVEQEKIHGWWISATQKSAPVMLYLHGNASNNGDLVDNAMLFQQLGLSVLLIDYRGYGKSSATFPNEKRVYEDAEAAWKYLTATRNIEPQDIFVYGHSLGGAIAINLATKYPEMGGLITEGTFTSIQEIASSDSLFRFLPLNWIVTQRFDSISKIKSLETPILIFHGDADRIVPVAMAEKLFAAAPEPKQLVIIPQAEHNNLQRLGGKQYLSSIERFIQTARSDRRSSLQFKIALND